MHKPGILWVNTAILLASSFVLELARRALRTRHRDRFKRVVDPREPFWASCSSAVRRSRGCKLQSAGVFLATNPSSAFFYYYLTGAHAVHLIGGAAALLYVDVQALRLRLGPRQADRDRCQHDLLAFSRWAVALPDGALYVWG